MAHILVVDDDEQTLGLMRKLLEKAQYQVSTATNGADAINIYRSDPTDLVITDLIMPDKEGIETIMDLRHEFPEIKIIAMSGGSKYSAIDYLPLAKKLGALYTFEKPIEREEMLSVIATVLQD